MSEDDKKRYKELLEQGDQELIKNKRYDKAVSTSIIHRNNFTKKP